MLGTPAEWDETFKVIDNTGNLICVEIVLSRYFVVMIGM